MKRLLLYCLFFTVLFSGCEDIYTPKIDAVEDVMVADARIVYGQNNNLVRLYNSVGFYEGEHESEGIPGATVKLIDNNGDELELMDIGGGNYELTGTLNPELNYKLHIEKFGNTFESSFEPVPKVPAIDTVYGIPDLMVIQKGGDNDVDNFREIPGVQLYADITSNLEMPWYRFTARKVLQFTYPVEVIIFGNVDIETMYAWNSFFPQGIFNIAAPPEYSSSKDIYKHPLFFMEKRVEREPEHTFQGWILILYQHGISESAYSYYNDLNNQLNSDGKLFDPLYVQARNNLKCVSDSEQLIFGNFEIATISESRYFVQYVSEELGYVVQPITEFYQIPFSGEQLSILPEFWEYLKYASE